MDGFELSLGSSVRLRVAMRHTGAGKGSDDITRHHEMGRASGPSSGVIGRSRLRAAARGWNRTNPSVRVHETGGICRRLFTGGKGARKAAGHGTGAGAGRSGRGYREIDFALWWCRLDR